MSNTPPRYIVIYLDEYVPGRDMGYYIVDTASGEIAAGYWYTEEKAQGIANAMNESEE